MADRRRSRSPRPERNPGLSAALRREARADRPVFSTALHERIRAAVGETPRRRGVRGSPRRPWLRETGLVGGLATVVVAVVLLADARRPVVRSPDPVAATAVGTDVPGIERFPTPGEITAGLLAEVQDLAEVAVGVPVLADLAAFDANAIAWADDAVP